MGAARRFVTAVMDALGLPAGNIPLLVSELATNAVKHARSVFTVTVSGSPGGVRVEVADDDPRQPKAEIAGGWAQSGRGLFLVQSLATRWGVERAREGGKRIWFEVPNVASAPEIGKDRATGH